MKFSTAYSECFTWLLGSKVPENIYMKNHELSNDIPDSTIETQWSDLEKMGKEGFRGKKESVNNSERKSPEQKEAELQLAAAKVREAFVSKVEKHKKEQPISQTYNTETTPSKSPLENSNCQNSSLGPFSSKYFSSSFCSIKPFKS